MKTKVSALILMAVFISGLLVFACISEEPKKTPPTNEMAQRAKFILIKACEKHLVKGREINLGCKRYLARHNS